jgi:hypothetical protein
VAHQGLNALLSFKDLQFRMSSFKYADKIGAVVGPAALAASVASNKYNRQRLLRFAEICRVKQAVAAAERSRRQRFPVELPKGEEAPKPERIWVRDLLEKQVGSEPIRRLATKYGVSDVAIHKQCKKMGTTLPGAATGQSRPARRRLDMHRIHPDGRIFCLADCSPFVRLADSTPLRTSIQDATLYIA